MFRNEDELTEAVAKLHIDAQPRPEHRAALRRQMLAAFEPGPAEGVWPLRRARPAGLRSSIIKSRFVRAAAVAAAVVCVVGVVAVWNPTGGNGIALAQVRQRVEQARTACFKLTWYRDGKAEYTGEVKWREPGLMRWEVPGFIAIYHWDKGRFMVLMTETKTAHSADIKDLENPYERDWIRNLKKMIGSDSAEEVEDKDISGRKAKGWRFEEEQWVCTVWADAENGALLAAEFKTGNTRMVMSDFVLDKELPESLFKLKAPDDYFHTRAKFGQADPSEKDVILLLRIWAMGNGDTFPDALDVRKWAEAAPKADWKRLGIKSQEEARETSDAISRGFWFLHSVHDQSYVGKGVRLGVKEKPVFWYRPAEAEKYRVIYGDLSIKEVAAEDLPKQPETQPAETQPTEKQPAE